LLIGKVLQGDGNGSYDSIVNGIRWAVNWRGPNGERTRVINMSLGGPYNHEGLHNAVKYAVEQGVVVVCASGNEGDGSTATNEYSYPSAYEEVVEVGAIDDKKQLALFSNTNEQIDVVALGTNVLSTHLPNVYRRLSGTSMATPHVSGAIALLIAEHEQNGRQLTEKQIVELLFENVEKLSIDGVGNGAVVLKPYEPTEFERVVEPIVEETLKIIPQGDRFSIGLFTKEEAERILVELQK
jgi:major intracellular serine protease